MVQCAKLPGYYTVKFQEFVNELNPRYVVPGRTAMNKELDLLLQGLKGNYVSILTHGLRKA